MLYISKDKEIENATVNEKGQITIPSKMRKKLDTRLGSHVLLFAGPESFVVSRTGPIMDGFGSFATNSPKASTIEEMAETKEKLYGVLAVLLNAKEIRFEYPDEVSYAYELFTNQSVDFAYALIGAISRKQGCETTVTFDRKAAKLAEFSGV